MANTQERFIASREHLMDALIHLEQRIGCTQSPVTPTQQQLDDIVTAIDAVTATATALAA
jgi:hypothetical protein